jgi:hypothetical protein
MDYKHKPSITTRGKREVRGVEKAGEDWSRRGPEERIMFIYPTQNKSLFELPTF